MSPNKATHNMANGTLGHPELGRQAALALTLGRRCAYLDDKGFIQFALTMLAAAPHRFRVNKPIGTAFCAAVGHIGFLCAEKQVVRADTTWVITMMQDFHVFRNRAVGQFIGKAVGKYAFQLASGPKSAISLSSGPRPHPTWAKLRAMWRNWAGLVHFLPEEALALCGKLRVHLESPTQIWGATLPAVSAARGLPIASIIAPLYLGVNYA